MSNKAPKSKIIKFNCKQEENEKLIVDMIASRCDLSKIVIKKLMNFGAVFQTIKNSRKRARKAKSIARAGDLIECYFDPRIDLDQKYEFKKIYSTKYYGVFHKPVGAITEGNNFGDRISLLREAEKSKRFAHVVNRLDTETEGLILIAFDSRTQNSFQEMWRNQVVKSYQAIVEGEFPKEKNITDDISNKYSETNCELHSISEGQSNVIIKPVTERKFQIRTHLSRAGHTIIGDGKYSKKYKSSDSLKLVLTSLEFKDPLTRENVKVEISSDRMLF